MNSRRAVLVVMEVMGELAAEALLLVCQVQVSGLFSAAFFVAAMIFCTLLGARQIAQNRLLTMSFSFVTGRVDVSSGES